MVYRRFWILGAGHFGQVAVRRIRRHIPDAELVVIDNGKVTVDTEKLIRADGITWLSENLQELSPVDMVVPAIPVHVAAGWLHQRLADHFILQTIEPHVAWTARLPDARQVQPGQYSISYADFLCPDNCPEPKKICTHTKKERPIDLFRLLASLAADDLLPVVIRSYQLLPGVGGLVPAELFSALAKVEHLIGKPLMVATACRCHGVVDFCRLERKKG